MIRSVAGYLLGVTLVLNELLPWHSLKTDYIVLIATYNMQWICHLNESINKMNVWKVEVCGEGGGGTRRPFSSHKSKVSAYCLFYSHPFPPSVTFFISFPIPTLPSILSPHPVVTLSSSTSLFFILHLFNLVLLSMLASSSSHSPSAHFLSKCSKIARNRPL